MVGRGVVLLGVGRLRMVECAHAFGQNRNPIGIENEGTYVDQEPR